MSLNTAFLIIATRPSKLPRLAAPRLRLYDCRDSASGFPEYADPAGVDPPARPCRRPPGPHWPGRSPSLTSMDSAIGSAYDKLSVRARCRRLSHGPRLGGRGCH